MKRNTVLILLVLFAYCFMGCASIDPCSKYADVSVSKNFIKDKNRVAILPFINSGKDGFDYFASDQLAQELMQLGFMVVERQQIQVLFNELKLDMSGNLSRSDLAKIGQLSSIDVLVIGTVKYTFQPSKASRRRASGATYYANGIALRFIDVASGEVFLSGRCDHIGDDISWGIREISCRIKNKTHSDK